MPAEAAGAVASPEIEAGQTEVAQPTDKGLKFSVADVMRKAGLPENIRKSITANQSEEKKEEQEVKPVTPEPDSEVEQETKEPEPVKAEEPKEGDEEKDEDEIEEEEPRGRLTIEKVQRIAEKRLRRIDKLTAARGRAEGERDSALEQVAQLQNALEEASPVVVSGSVNDPLANVNNLAQLNQVYQEAKFIRDTARKHPDGYVINEGTDKEQVVTREKIMDDLSRAEDMLNEYIPQKRVQLQEGARYDQIAKQIYPNLFNRNHEDHQAARQVMASLPGIASRPERNIVIGDYLRGLRARLESVKKNGHAQPGKPNGSTDPKPDLDERIIAPKPPIAEDSPNPPTRTTAPSARKKIEQAEEQVKQSGGDQRALKNLIKAQWEARTRTGSRALV